MSSTKDPWPVNSFGSSNRFKGWPVYGMLGLPAVVRQACNTSDEAPWQSICQGGERIYQ
jgi:hypothetical protein